MIDAEAVVAQGTLKAVCSRDELTRALGIVSRGVSTRTTVQILAGILISTTEGKLNLAATDMELSLRTSLEANVEADGSRPVLTGVLMRFERGKLVMAATDSYRLSVKETPLEGSLPELEAIVPARALGELARIAQAGDAIELGVHENQVVFGTGDAWLTTRRIDGQFPNYKQLVPETFDYDVSVPRDG